MTTFPKPLKDRLASTIREQVAKTRVHAQKISQLESANAANTAAMAVQAATIASQATTIASQGSSITSLNTTVANLLSGNTSIGGNLTVSGSITANGGSGNVNGNLQGTINGQTLSGSQVLLLSTLHQMSHQGDVSGGASLSTLITAYNTTLHELQSSNYQS